MSCSIVSVVHDSDRFQLQMVGEHVLVHDGGDVGVNVLIQQHPFSVHAPAVMPPMVTVGNSASDMQQQQQLPIEPITRVELRLPRCSR